MNKNIRYQGLNFAEDDIAAPQGALAIAANAEIHNGAIRPAVLVGSEIPALVYNGSVATLRYVHVTTDGTRLIATLSAASHYTGLPFYHWFQADGTYGGFIFSAMATGEASIESIGNTLVIIDAAGPHYILWKNAQYNYLGQKPPFIPLQFSLQRDFSDDKNTDDHEVTVDGDQGMLKTNEDPYKRDIRQQYQALVTEQVMAKINHRIDALTSDGFFYAPFLVRYALRIYDGSLILHSPAVLMFPLLRRPVLTAIEKAQVMKDGHYKFDNSKKSYKYYIYILRASLHFRCLNTSDINLIKSKWGDIIRSIDIFITPQFSRIDNAKTIDAVSLFADNTNESILDGSFSLSPYSDFRNTYPNTSEAINEYSFNLPEISQSEFLDKIHNASQFFLLTSINIEDLPTSTSFQKLSFQPARLKNITAQPLMDDDYKSHNLLVPIDDSQRHAYVYNHRLHLYGLQEILFSGFPPGVLFPYFSAGENVSAVAVTVKADDGTHYVQADGSALVPEQWLFRGYKFYPDSRATMMDFVINGAIYHVSARLRPHNALNAAYGFTQDGFTEAYRNYGPVNSPNFTPVPLPNKIYTSEVNNPFVFPPASINTVGTGSILAIAAATRAISQGQFGQFPLIAFATDGIWALQVSQTGTFASVHPISREVCSNPKSVCQLDQQVLFATKRGLALVATQDVTYISDILDGPLPAGNMADNFPRLANFFSDKASDSPTTRQHKLAIRSILGNTNSPINFFQNAQPIYDFINSRLIITNSHHTSADTPALAYVYSFNDRAWTTMAVEPLISAVAAYPSPYLQFQDGSITVLNQTYPNTRLTTPAKLSTWLTLTRPLSFGDAMYAINDFAHNDNIQHPITIFLFGSNDLAQWHYIGRTNQRHAAYLPSHAYRFFRMALTALSTPSEQYISTSLNITEKFPKL